MLVQGANAVCVTDNDDMGKQMLTFLAERSAVKLVLLRGASSSPTVHLPTARAYGIQARALGGRPTCPSTSIPAVRLPASVCPPGAQTRLSQHRSPSSAQGVATSASYAMHVRVRAGHPLCTRLPAPDLRGRPSARAGDTRRYLLRSVRSMYG